MLPRRDYKDGIQLSVIGFGGVLLMRETAEHCAAAVAGAFARGVNYFDVAPFYGNAEEMMGPALEPYRDRVFLACKTMDRTAEGARFELERSLSRLRTSHFDLYQFHSVKTIEEVDQILGPGGAGETFLRARDEGKVKYLGFSAHDEAAALKLLAHFPLDSILFPVNYISWAQGFGPEMMALAKEKRIARLALKAIALGPWPEGTDRKTTPYPKCWYRPIDDPEHARAALRFTLSEDVTATVPPGDQRLFDMTLGIAESFTVLSDAERAALLGSVAGQTPLFPVKAAA